MVFTLFVDINSLQKFPKQKKIDCFEKMSIFFTLTAFKNVKIQKIKFEVGFSYKYCI